MLKAAPLALLLLAATVSGALAQTQPRRPPPPSPTDKASDCASPPGDLPKAWDGQAFAIDGNTLAGVGLRPHIRLWGLQVPELRDAATKAESVTGMRARAALEDLLDKADHKVKCRVARFDRECRLVAQCSLDDSPAGDIGGGMLAGGMAYGFALDETLPWEPRASQRYASAEAEARKARRGLWPTWLGDR